MMRKVAGRLDPTRLTAFCNGRSAASASSDSTPPPPSSTTRWMQLPSVASWLVPGGAYREPSAALADKAGGEGEGEGERGRVASRSKTPWSRAHPHAAARPRTSVREVMLAQDRMRVAHISKLESKRLAREQELAALSQRQRRHDDAKCRKQDQQRRWMEALEEVMIVGSALVVARLA